MKTTHGCDASGAASVAAGPTVGAARKSVSGAVMAPMGARRFRLTPGRETNRRPSGGASDREVVGLLGRKGGLYCLYSSILDSYQTEF